MDLEVRPFPVNQYPPGAVLIKGSEPAYWLAELQRMNILLAGVDVYPLPGDAPDIVWGCLATGMTEMAALQKNTCCQLVYDRLYIPECSVLFPKLTKEEIIQLCSGSLYLLHPQLGLINLQEPLNWRSLLQRPEIIEAEIVVPENSPAVPQGVRSFQIREPNTDDIIDRFEENNYPVRERFSDKPLNALEKIKLFFYNKLLETSGDKNKYTSSRLTRWISAAFPPGKKIIEKLQEDQQSLEKRNERHLDKLEKLFSKDIGEALKYAIPLDANGAGRGGSTGEYSRDGMIFLHSPGPMQVWEVQSSPMTAIPDSFVNIRQQLSNS
jgi:hypothetical protein